jgi:hypothetical protein
VNLGKAERKAKQFLERKFGTKSVLVNEVRTEGLSPLTRVVVRGTFELSGMKKCFEVVFETSFLCRMVGWQVTE